MQGGIFSAFESHIKKFEAGLFTSLPAQVISFDANTQTISAQPVMLEPYTDGASSEFPVISNIPVIFPSAGGGSLTFPIQTGDEVLLTFSARSFDTWWDTSEFNQLSKTRRCHNITDAIAIVGLTSKNNSVNASTEDVELKFNDNVIRLKADGNVEVETASKFSVTNASEELVSLISQLADEVSKITTNTVYGLSPINNKSAVAAIKGKIDTFKK